MWHSDTFPSRIRNSLSSDTSPSSSTLNHQNANLKWKLAARIRYLPLLEALIRRFAAAIVKNSSHAVADPTSIENFRFYLFTVSIHLHHEGLDNLVARFIKLHLCKLFIFKFEF